MNDGRPRSSTTGEPRCGETRTSGSGRSRAETPPPRATRRAAYSTPNLHAAIKALPWKDVTARRYDRDHGHGRRETRSVRTLTVTGHLDFPHVVQAVKILRHRTEAKTGKITRQTIYAITDMAAREASPQLIGRLARSQWGIEAVHHVRDTTFAEDASKIRSGHGPENMATLRNLTINTLRDHGHHSIAAGLREVSYTPFTRPLDLLGLS
jgi:predicted transposase YbfD/YdcC